MKTAISIPEKLFEAAEQFARGRGMSRSELYATALRHYLGEHRGEMITERLDEIYGGESVVWIQTSLACRRGRCRRMTGSAAWRSLVGTTA
jgi:metal-responsive CopG/Arc/MetJ family transcriptional regulator